MKDAGDNDTDDKDDDKSVLARAKKRFQESEDQWADVKLKAIEDTKFARLGEQWPPDAMQTREAEGRPCLTINKMPAFARQIVNDMRQNRPRIKTRAANSGACGHTAKIFDGIIRNIETISNADVAYDTAGESAVYGGIGFFRIDIDYEHDDSFDMGIFIRRIPNAISVSWDATPDSGHADSAGWRYAFLSELIPKDTFKADYPDFECADFGDAPVDLPWMEGDMVRVAEYWERKEVDREILQLANGEVVRADVLAQLEPEQAMLPEYQVVARRTTKTYEVTQYLMSGADILKTTPWPGSYIPIVPIWGEEVNIEGQTYYQSLIRHVKDAQRMFNYWRTAATELVALAPKAPFIAEDGSIPDGEVDKWNSANTKSWPVLLYKKGSQKPERQMFAGIPAGALQEATNASDDMHEVLGMHAEKLGEPGQALSGIAVHKRQVVGDLSTFAFPDNQNRGIRCGGVILVDLIPKVFSKPKVMRIMGADGKCENVQVNAPTQVKDEETGQMVDRIYDLTVGKYDVMVEAGPSYSTQRAETADMLTQIMSAAPNTAPLLAAELMKMSDFPDADRTAKILATMMPPEARAVFDGTPPPQPGPPPEVQAAQAKAQADMAINTQKAQQEFQLEQQRAQHKQQLESTQAQADIAVMQQKAQAEMQIAQQRAQMEFELKRQEAKLAAELKVLGATQPAGMQ